MLLETFDVRTQSNTALVFGHFSGECGRITSWILIKTISSKALKLEHRHMIYQTPVFIKVSFQAKSCCWWSWSFSFFFFFCCTSLVRNRPGGAIFVNEDSDELQRCDCVRPQLHFFFTTLVCVCACVLRVYCVCIACVRVYVSVCVFPVKQVSECPLWPFIQKENSTSIFF